MLLEKGPSMEKKCSLFLSVLIFTALILISIAAGDEHRKLISKSQGVLTEELSVKSLEEDGGNVLQHRFLGMTNDDYGNYEPTPSLSKPPFKLIPN